MYGCNDAGLPASGPAIEMNVRCAGRSRLGRRLYQIIGDGHAIGGARPRNEVFPFLEWGINARVMATASQYIQLHAASLVRGGEGFVFAGASGNGKSTLAAGLLAHGWQYLCDEFALIQAETLRLHSFPKALCIKQGSFAAIERLGLSFARRRDYVKGLKGRVAYIDPRQATADQFVTPSPIRYVIFPRYGHGKPPRLQRIPRAHALVDLAGCVFNRQAFADQGLAILSEVVRRAECFRLETGDISETRELLETQLGLAPAANVATDFGTTSGWRPTLASRRDVLRRGAKLAYVAPGFMVLAAPKAFAGGSNPSGVCSGGAGVGELCGLDSDCCSGDCELGVCQ